MMVGWSRAEVVVSLSGVDRLLLKRVADALDPVTVQPTAGGPRRLREPSLTVEELAVLDGVGAVALSGDEFAELQAGVLSHRGDEVVRSVLKRLLTVNDPHFRGKHVSAEDIV